MAWQPQEAGVQQLSQLLKDSLSGTPQEREKQKQAEAVSFDKSGSWSVEKSMEY